MAKKEYNFVKIERPKFEESPAQIMQDIKSIDVEIELEEKRTNKYKQELIKELQKLKKEITSCNDFIKDHICHCLTCKKKYKLKNIDKHLCNKKIDIVNI